MPTRQSTSAMSAGPRLRDILLGLWLGVCGLAAIALLLSILDPILRDQEGVIFTLPWIK
ncbi:MAG TPA: hypothetical protein VHA55_06790 [Pseudorhodoplanes sp.]|nr:hypothetical protein [Pseudorhodoplanes sp.]